MTDVEKAYAEGFRAGALAERARAVGVCLRARTRKGARVDVAMVLAEAIGQAGDAIPSPEMETKTWTLRGRISNELPAFMKPEDEEDPFP